MEGIQLLAQVAGRAGRGEVPGEVIVQTYTPFQPAIQAARRVDYEGFCDQEMAFRRELHYPPFSRLVCVLIRGRSEPQAALVAASLERRLRDQLDKRVILSSPSPAPLARAKGLYRFHLLMRSASAKAMTEPLRRVLKGMRLPAGVVCSVDVDALSLL